VEATQGVRGGFNHGKFAVGLFEPEEAERRSALERELGVDVRLLGRCGWAEGHVLVIDLQTGEGAMFLPGGSPRADLDKHRVWVCPMFEPFLGWLYDHIAREEGPDSEWFDALPDLVEIPDAPASMQGYRREGRECEHKWRHYEEIGVVCRDCGAPAPAEVGESIRSAER
jgi:hypothetical protein